MMKSKYGRNPKLNPKTHCVMVRFDDVEWNRFLTMYEESNVYAKAVFLKAHFFGQKFKDAPNSFSKIPIISQAQFSCSEIVSLSSWTTNGRTITVSFFPFVAILAPCSFAYSTRLLIASTISLEWLVFCHSPLESL